MSSFITDISKMVDMNLGLLLKQTKITILGKSIIMIEGLDRIKEYTDERIKLSRGKSSVLVEGENLKIRTLSKNDIIIEGKINKISL